MYTYLVGESGNILKCVLYAVSIFVDPTSWAFVLGIIICEDIMKGFKIAITCFLLCVFVKLSENIFENGNYEF
jgi:hypothetical protein